MKKIYRFFLVFTVITAFGLQNAQSQEEGFEVSGSNLEYGFYTFGDANSFHWDFGDGYDTTSMMYEAYHTYDAPGIYNVCLTIEGGDTTTYCKDVYADTTYDVVNNNEITFDAYVQNDTVEITAFLPTDNSVSYFWDFGNGKTSTTTPTYIYYNKPGKYTITLTVRNDETGTVVRKAKTVRVGTIPCEAAFNYTYETIGSNRVRFTNKSTGNITRNIWNFGDYSYSVLPDPLHEYEPGIYDVNLTVIDTAGAGCIDQHAERLRVGDVPCNASFSYYVDSLENTIYFNSNSIGLDNASAHDIGSKFYWVFGDGTVSHKPNPVKKFDKPGYYEVLFSTFNTSSMCMGFHSEKILIGSQGKDCEADFIFAPAPGNAIRFADKSSGDGLSYIWNFGDGEKDFIKDPVHIYDNPGIYSVCLLVKNADGLENITCKKVRVGEPAPDQNCKADFFYMIDSLESEATFINKSKGNSLQYSWDLGDGNNSDIADPTHTYGTNDYYRVKLRIKDTVNNCVSHAFKLVNINAKDTLKASFGYVEEEPQLKASSYPVDFVAISHGDAAKLKWEFDDGTVDSTTTNPTHNYDAPGDYEVCLTISDPNTGSEDIYCEIITVGTDVDEINAGNATVKIYPNPSTGKTNVAYTIDNNSTVELAVYSVDGRKLQTIVNEEKIAGEHVTTLDASNLQTGLYYVRLITGSKAYTKKLMLIK